MRRSFADADDAELDGAVRLMLAARSAGRPSDDLLDRVVAGSTAQSQTRGVGRRLGALVAAAAALAIGVLLLLNPRPAREPSSTPNLGAASTTTAAASDLELTPPPHVPDSCPVTPVTRLAGGSAPEVDMSGLRWRMGGSAWVAGIPEKIVWLPDDPGASGDVVAYATPLSVPLDPSGRIADARDRDLVVVPGNGFVGGIALPRPGCWLVTAVWPSGASSVVVSVAARPAGATPAPQMPEPVASLPPPDTCRSSPAETVYGEVYRDGTYGWQVPHAGSILIGKPDKIVFGSEAYPPEKTVVGLPLRSATNPAIAPNLTIRGDVPVDIGGGDMGIGITLPERDCWAFVYLDPIRTSTVVVDLR